jgi:ABC-2 type transport system ATP-binding protein
MPSPSRAAAGTELGPPPTGPTARTPSARPPESGPRPAPPDGALEVRYPVVMRDVTKRFGDVDGIDGISLSVPAGTIVGVIGPSGSGKTTTIRTLTGALEPTSGDVRVLGQDPRHFTREARESIGYMPQAFVLYPDLTATENVEFMGALFGMLWRRRRSRVRQVLQLVELWDVRGRRASHLSGGMQRRLELACALVHDPLLLFLDEPTAGLDPLLRQAVWNELRRLREAGRTMLVTTQYVGEAEYCDAVALIARGQLIALAPPEELRRQATGGDVLEVELTNDFDGRLLTTVEGVLRVRQQSPTELLVTVDDAGSAAPRLVEAVAAAGGEVASSREYRPNFDEVFAVLVERHEASLESGARGAGGAGEEASRTATWAGRPE